jgi:hypothetical protein
MNGDNRKWVLVYERALEGVQAIGPFDDRAAAKAFAREHHSFPQVWREAPLHSPEEHAAKETAD